MRPAASGSTISLESADPSRRVRPRGSVVLALLLAGLGCSSSSDESSRPAAPLYSVDGSFLRDRNGRAIEPTLDTRGRRLLVGAGLRGSHRLEIRVHADYPG